MYGYGQSGAPPDNGYNFMGFQGFSPSMDIGTISRQIAAYNQMRQQQRQQIGQNLGGLGKAIAQMRMQRSSMNAEPPADNPDQVSQQDALNYLSAMGMQPTPENINWVMSGGNQPNGQSY